MITPVHFFSLRPEKDASVLCSDYGSQGSRNLAAEILEPGYRKEVCCMYTLSYNPHVFSPAPCLSSAVPQIHDFITSLV